MHRSWLMASLTVMLAGWSANPALAWNKAGHMVTGAIAYSVLKQDSPPTIDKVVAVLKKHPAYEKRWQKMIHQPYVPEGDRNLYLFMLAARWPDDARGDPTFYPPDLHRDRWHYINLPYKPDGQPDDVQTAPPDEISIFRGYEANLARLGTTTPDTDRAVALCWIFHLIGDVHQPLHTTSLFTTQFQKEDGKLIGDRGGTRFYIRAREEGSVISLHKLWDDLILGSDRFLDTRNEAIKLRLRPEFARDKLTELAETEFTHWASKESLPLAREVVYRQGRLPGSSVKSEAPVLHEEYTGAAKAVAERRVVLAGYRLAAVLKKRLE